jgi:hypothetical protein
MGDSSRTDFTRAGNGFQERISGTDEVGPAHRGLSDAAVQSPSPDLLRGAGIRTVRVRSGEAERDGVRATARPVKVTPSTVGRHAPVGGRHARRLHDEKSGFPRNSREVQLDETSSFVYFGPSRMIAEPERSGSLPGHSM